MACSGLRGEGAEGWTAGGKGGTFCPSDVPELRFWIFGGRDELGRLARFSSIVRPIPMQVEPFTFNSFMTNCYLCYDQGEAVLVDASCDTEAECAQVKGVIDEYGLDVQHLLLTHAHVDHIFGCRFFVPP